MSQLDSAQRRAVVSAQGEEPPYNGTDFYTSLANFGGGLPSEWPACCAAAGWMFVGSTPEMLMLTDTPALRSLCTLLAPGLDLAIFHA